MFPSSLGALLLRDAHILGVSKKAILAVATIIAIFGAGRSHDRFQTGRLAAAAAYALLPDFSLGALPRLGRPNMIEVAHERYDV